MQNRILTTFRLTLDCAAMIEALQISMGISKTAIIETAIRRMLHYELPNIVTNKLNNDS